MAANIRIAFVRLTPARQRSLLSATGHTLRRSSVEWKSRSRWAQSSQRIRRAAVDQVVRAAAVAGEENEVGVGRLPVDGLAGRATLSSDAAKPLRGSGRNCGLSR